MARNINGGTDHIYWTIPGAPTDIGTISFRMRTTQVTANTVPMSYWLSNSRSGWGFVLNGVAGKINFQGWSSTTQRISLTSSTSVNDGNEHHVLVDYGRNSANGCSLFIDGNQEATGSSSGAWVTGSPNIFFEAGDQVDTFWPSYVGDIWEIAHWGANPVLNGDEIAALAKGFSPKLIRPASLLFYAPLVGDTHDLKGNVMNGSSGTSVATQGKVIGGAV